MSSANTAIIFLHIEKTAGRSINALLDEHFDEKKILHLYPPPLGESLFDGMLKLCKGVDCLVGHADYGVHAHFGIKDYIYFSFVRNPVQRLLSEFHYFQRRNRNVPKAEWRVKNHMIAECATALDFVRHPKRVRNSMVARISGKMNGFPVTLENAQKHVVDDFSFIGIAERMQESLARLNALLGIEEQTIPLLNKTHYEKPDTQSLSELESCMRELDALDFQFYEWCNERL